MVAAACFLVGAFLFLRMLNLLLASPSLLLMLLLASPSVLLMVVLAAIRFLARHRCVVAVARCDRTTSHSDLSKAQKFPSLTLMLLLLVMLLLAGTRVL